jgi:hypothetical protein
LWMFIGSHPHFTNAIQPEDFFVNKHMQKGAQVG